MTIFYSAQTRGFYVDSVHGDAIPADRVEVTQDQHWELIAGEQNGMTIVMVDGQPVLQKLPIDRTIEQWAQVIGRRRYAEEVAGVTFEGHHFETTRDSQSLISCAVMHAMSEPDYRCLWKTEKGFREMTGSSLRGTLSAIRTHVQSCFDREAQLLAHLEAGTFTESMLDEGWPA